MILRFGTGPAIALRIELSDVHPSSHLQAAFRGLPFVLHSVLPVTADDMIGFIGIDP